MILRSAPVPGVLLMVALLCSSPSRAADCAAGSSYVEGGTFGGKQLDGFCVSDAAVKKAASVMKFEGDKGWQRYEAVAIRWTSVKKRVEFGASIDKKAAALEELDGRMMAIFKGGDPATGECALLQLGVANEQLASQLAHVTVPPEAPGELVTAVRAQLAAQAQPYFARAASAFVLAVKTSHRTKTYTACSVAAVQQLEAMALSSSPVSPASASEDTAEAAAQSARAADAAAPVAPAAKSRPEAAQPERPKAPQALSAKYVEEVNDSSSLRFTVEDYVNYFDQFLSMREFEAAQEERIRRTQRDHRMYLEYVKEQFSNEPAAVADVDRRLATADADVARLFASARAELEADPAKHLTPVLESEHVDRLEQVLSLAKNMKTLAQTCGSYDFTTIPSTNEDLRRERREYARYGDCVIKYRDDQSFVLAEIEFSGATERAVSTRMFTCSRRPHPHCLPDATWSRVGDIATLANLRIVQAAERINKDRHDANLEVQRLNEWGDKVDAQVKERNRQ